MGTSSHGQRICPGASRCGRSGSPAPWRTMSGYSMGRAAGAKNALFGDRSASRLETLRIRTARVAGGPTALLGRSGELRESTLYGSVSVRGRRVGWHGVCETVGRFRPRMPSLGACGAVGPEIRVEVLRQLVFDLVLRITFGAIDCATWSAAKVKQCGCRRRRCSSYARPQWVRSARSTG